VGNPRILILDDSASALDYATDAKLRKAISCLPDETTVFIVSQRAASVIDADKIIVLDDGEISAIGTHSELLNNSAVYREIYDSQFEEAKQNG
jgi:ABC-type multidrug transport system fused ATPase/permease subunit